MTYNLHDSSSFHFSGQACSAPAGFAPNPFDCGSFLVCNHGKYQVQPCAEGLHWDTSIHACNTKELAGCQLGKIVPFTRVWQTLKLMPSS